MNTELLKDIFSYHAPKTEQKPIYEKINELFLNLATELAPLLPDGAGKVVTIRKIAEARMQANATVALEGKF